MWRCDIPDSNGVQQSNYIYLGIRTRRYLVNLCMIFDSFSVCFMVLFSLFKMMSAASLCFTSSATNACHHSHRV